MNPNTAHAIKLPRVVIVHLRAHGLDVTRFTGSLGAFRHRFEILVAARSLEIAREKAVKGKEKQTKVSKESKNRDPERLERTMSQ